MFVWFKNMEVIIAKDTTDSKSETYGTSVSDMQKRTDCADILVVIL